MIDANPFIFKESTDCKIRLSTICLHILFVYKALKEARGLLPHILCIMCIQVLRDGCVGVSEARCNIDGFGARLNQARCVGVAEAVRVESQLM